MLRKRDARIGLVIAVAATMAIPPAGHAQDLPPAAPTVSELVITPEREVPVPGVGTPAPLYSTRQLERIICEAEAQVKGTSLIPRRGPGGRPGGRKRGVSSVAMVELAATRAAGYRALQATREAQRIRQEAAAGSADVTVLESSELERQKRVVALEQQLMQGQSIRLGDPLTDLAALFDRNQTFPGLTLKLAEARPATVSGKRQLVVTGTIRNDRSRAARPPPILVSALDENGLVLESKLADARTSIPARGASPFAYRYPDPPQTARNVRVSFSPSFMPPPRESDPACDTKLTPLPRR